MFSWINCCSNDEKKLVDTGFSSYTISADRVLITKHTLLFQYIRKDKEIITRYMIKRNHVTELNEKDM